MALTFIRPNDLPAASAVLTTSALVVDDGLSVEKATPAQVVNAGRPVASEAEAIAGVRNDRAMTPLTTKQAVDATLEGFVIIPPDALTGAIPFSSRAEFEASSLADDITAWTVDHAGYILSYRRDPDGTAITSANGVKGSPADVVMPDHWAENTIPGETDMASAIMLAADYVASLGGGVVEFGRGVYCANQVVLITGRGVTFQGQGSGGRGPVSSFFVGTKIKGNHSNGPVVHFTNEEFHLKNIAIDSSSARFDGGQNDASYGRNNFGLLVEPPDAEDVFIADFSIENVHVLNQPASGAVFSGACRRGVVDQLLVRRSLGHGIVVTNGPFVGRINPATGGNGMIDFRSCTSDINAGYGVLAGDPGFTDTRVFRLLFRSLESSDNCTDAALRIAGEASQLWMRGDEIQVEMSAVRGRLGGGVYSGGIYAEGRGHYYVGNRFVDCPPYSVKIGNGWSSSFWGRQFVIDGIRVFDDTGGGPQTYAVLTSSTTAGVFIRATNLGNIVNLIDGNATGVTVSDVSQSGDLIDTVRGSLVVGSSLKSPLPILGQTFVMANNSVQDITFATGLNGGIITLSTNSPTAPSGMAWVRARSSPAIQLIAGANTSVLTLTTTEVDATSATSGHLTICALIDQRIRIVNRLGGERRVTLSYAGVDLG